MYRIEKRTSRTIIIEFKAIKNSKDFEDLTEALFWDDLYVEFLDNFYLEDTQQGAFFYPEGIKVNGRVFKLYNDDQFFNALKQGGIFVFKRVDKETTNELKREYKF